MRLKFIVLLFFFFVPIFSIHADECDDWFKKLKIKTSDPDCEMKCSVARVNMGTFNCPMGCPRHCNSKKNPEEKKKDSGQCDESNSKKPDCCDLKSYVEEERSKNDNRCKAFSKILDEIIQDSHGQKDRVALVMENLRNLLIGDGLTRNSRGTGPCFAGNFKGSKGLKDEYKDDSDQIQHAFAGVYIGYKYGMFACKLIEVFVEDSEIDKKLYQATCPIGYSILNSNNPDLNAFRDDLIKTIGDASCGGE